MASVTLRVRLLTARSTSRRIVLIRASGSYCTYDSTSSTVSPSMTSSMFQSPAPSLSFLEGHMHHMRVAVEVVQVAEHLLVGPEQEHAHVVGLAAASSCISRMGLESSFWSMNLSICPSESQVMSARLPRCSGSSSSRWIGQIGNSWSIAQWSGRLWKIERLA